MSQLVIAGLDGIPEVLLRVESMGAVVSGHGSCAGITWTIGHCGEALGGLVVLHIPVAVNLKGIVIRQLKFS